MSVDLLRVEANERVDLLDFQQLANRSMEEALRVQGNTFLTNPLGPFRSFILDGFALSNPSGKQLTVTKGRGLLARRVGGTVKYGILTSEGDATKTIDLAAMAATTYNVYIRFEFIDGDSSSRIFWDATGTGKEFAQTMSTKLKANWSLRVETGSPGSEWLQIGTANNAGVSLVIVDQRPFYFEGLPSATYASGWSTDGGGSANDRNADRATYGVKDLQTFTNATRQCLEDIKGRGLRRWWSRDIGGMNIGFDAAPVEDRLAIGDANMYLQGHTTYPEFRMGSNGDSLAYDRPNVRWVFKVNNVEAARLDNDGLAVARGITGYGSASHQAGGEFTGFAGGGYGVRARAGATAGWTVGIEGTGAGIGPGGYFSGGILPGETGHGAIAYGGLAGGGGFWGKGGGLAGAVGSYGEGGPAGGIGVRGLGILNWPGGEFVGGLGGYGAIIQADAVAPAKAAVRIVPQNATPTLPTGKGDLRIDSVDARIKTYNGSYEEDAVCNIFTASESSEAKGTSSVAEFDHTWQFGVISLPVIPAGTLRSGAVGGKSLATSIRVRAYLRIVTGAIGGGATFTTRLYAVDSGGNKLLVTLVAPISPSVTDTQFIDMLITNQGGVASCCGTVISNFAGLAAYYASNTLNDALANTLKLTGQFSANNASNAASLAGVIIDIA